MMSPREEIFKQLLWCSVVLYFMFRRKSLVLFVKGILILLVDSWLCILVLGHLRAKSTWDNDDI